MNKAISSLNQLLIFTNFDLHADVGFIMVSPSVFYASHIEEVAKRSSVGRNYAFAVLFGMARKIEKQWSIDKPFGQLDVAANCLLITQAAHLGSLQQYFWQIFALFSILLPCIDLTSKLMNTFPLISVPFIQGDGLHCS